MNSSMKSACAAQRHLAVSSPESVTNRRHAQNEMQVLLNPVHKGCLNSQLGGGPALGLQDGPDNAGDLLQILGPHQVGDLPTVQNVVDVLNMMTITVSHACWRQQNLDMSWTLMASVVSICVHEDGRQCCTCVTGREAEHTL